MSPHTRSLYMGLTYFLSDNQAKQCFSVRIWNLLWHLISLFRCAFFADALFWWDNYPVWENVWANKTNWHDLKRKKKKQWCRKDRQDKSQETTDKILMYRHRLEELHGVNRTWQASTRKVNSCVCVGMSWWPCWTSLEWEPASSSH